MSKTNTPVELDPFNYKSEIYIQNLKQKIFLYQWLTAYISETSNIKPNLEIKQE